MPAKPSNATTNANAGNGATATTVRHLLEQIKPGKPVRQGSLTIIPLFPVDELAVQHTGFLPLADALTQGLLTITEKQQASVPELLATCTAETPVVMLTGEQVIGGLQNRVLNATILVAAKTVLNVPVTCVEHGRWNSWSAPTPVAQGDDMSNAAQMRQQPPIQRYRMAAQPAPSFATEDTAYAGLRKKQMKSVSYALAAGGGYRSDQGEVWNEVATRMSTTGSHSPTAAMRALYSEPARAEKLTRMVETLPRPEGALGFVVAIGGKVVGAEVFADEALALAYWEKLTRSYALEALDTQQNDATPQESDSVNEEHDETLGAQLLQEACTAELQSYQSPGLGQDVRMSSKAVTGAGLVYGDAVVHLSLFAEDQEPQPAAQ